MGQSDKLTNIGDTDRTQLTPANDRQRLMLDRQAQLRICESRPSPDLSNPLQSISIDSNQLVGFAFPLLSLVDQLRSSLSNDDVEGLRSQVVTSIKTFETDALQQGVQQEKIKVARYALCSLLDETALNTPWGCNSAWSDQSLLIQFHQEAWGGEKFFHILKRLSQQPGTNLELLEFYYVCLSLGFEGKYRVEEHGASKLEDLREDLYRIIARQRGDFEHDLSIQWQGIKDQRNALIKYVPLWVFAVVAGVLLLVLYLGFNFSINRLSDPAFKSLYAIGREQTDAADSTVSPMANTRIDSLKRLLASEIQQGLLELVGENGASIIRLRSLFSSGSDRVTTGQLPLLDRIAQALAKVDGHITVAGHTDNVPIFNARFPSNWHLSKARAASVGRILQASADLKRPVSAEGRADNEPLASNNSKQNRTLNRRVDILIR